MVALYHALLRLRREDPVLAHSGRDGLHAEAYGNVLVVRRWTDRAARVLLANFGDSSARAPITGPMLLASTALELPALPPWSAVIVATET